NLPGHGESTPLAQNTLASHGAVLSAWLRQEIAGPFSLLGWSLGGMLALALADDHRLDVQRLALLSATPRFSSDEEWSHGLPQTQVKALIRNLRRRFEATLGDFFALTFAGEEISDERMRQIRNFALRQSALPDKATAASLLELFLDQDQRALLDHLQLPTLVIHGELDQITPLAAGRYLAQQLPDSRFVEIAGVGHAPFLSRPDSVAAAIKDFC
ncbi:MAG: alpha/beta fold hydrolase, partial [Desulfuromonadales bacterium]|nr:alpha/beta fold hydrolase [Desulfuromonadales bacterium]